MALGNSTLRTAIKTGILLAFSVLSFNTAISADDQLAALEKSAVEVLDKHCSSCHQAGKAKGAYKDRPAGNLGYVLDIEKLVSSGHIKPGLPNGSSLFIKMQSGEMPKGLSDQCLEITPPAGTYCGPDASEVKAIYDWIEKLKDRPKQVAREFVSNEAMIAAMVKDISEVSEPIRPQIRYITITNLFNAGDDDKAMAGYHMALTKLLNSLSFQSDPVELAPVDKNKTVFRINIGDLGWDEKKWNHIASHNPYAVEYNDINFKTLQTASGTTQPFLRGDWFTFAGSQPPLYYDILGLPDTKGELEKLLGLDVKTNIKNLKVARAGFQKSGVSENNRLIERHASRTGAYWESYDFAGNQDRQSFFKFPLGPLDAMGSMSQKFGFTADGGEVIFELPNGFHAYYLTDGEGKRLDKGPTSIVTDPQRRDRAVTNGISCMGCHDKGIKFNDHRPREKQDQVLEYIKQTAELSIEARDAVAAIYPTHDDFYKLMQKDAKRFETSLERAGVKMGYNLDGLEMVNGLFVRFENDLDIKQASAEFGMPEEEFADIAGKTGGKVFALKQRLKHGLVPRDQFIKEFSTVVSEITRDRMMKVAAVSLDKKTTASKVDIKKAEIIPAVKDKTFDLVFFPNQKEFIKGEPVSFIVKSEKSCYLTLINIPEKGETTVIFPNKFNQNNRIDAGTEYELPGKLIRKFTLRFAHSGEERVVAICNASRPDPLGISHDFGKAAFTTYDSYGQVITRSFSERKRTRQIIVEEGDSKSEALKTEREKQLPALVKDKKEKHIDIEARQAVLLNVVEK